jgi:hypothetical protein
VQLTYYDHGDAGGGADAWEPQAGDIHTLRHGYNLADLDRLARMALSREWARNRDWRHRYDIAWSAIAEALYAAAEPPEPGDLIRAGQESVTGFLHTELRHWGIKHDRSRRPSFAMYWDEVARHTASPENGIIERLALWQVWARLRDEDREALLALAIHGEYDKAAATLGLRKYTYYARVRRARVRFLRLWHEGESPSRLWGHDTRGEHVCRSGNDTVMGVLRRRAREKARQDRG